MRIVVTSVLVDDQEKAHRFYTDVLGFVTNQDIPMGEYRWLTVASPQDPDGTELLLEPMRTRPRVRSRLPWWRTAFRTRRSGWTTSRPRLGASERWGSASRRSRRRWVR